MAGKGGSSQSDRREEAQGKDTFRRSRQGDTAGTTEELQQEMALEAAPHCPYLASQLFCSWGHLSSGSTAHPISRCACIFNRSPTDSQHQVVPQVLLGAQERPGVTARLLSKLHIPLF